MFADEALLRVRAGRGGPGAVSFRHEKHVPRGGPDGGDGGRGGDVILVATRGLDTLSHFAGRRSHSAEDGGAGRGRLRHGADAPAVRLLVPVGTLAFDTESGDQLGELREDKEELLVTRGGRGGRGNAHFANSRNRAPRFSELGDPGEEREVRLELRLFADIGLVGAPNAGKSTLLAALTAARPRIAPYAFTTLEPELGVLEREDGERLVLAEVPGLIEGAAEGVGLGTDFLRHLSRTRVLVHVLDASQGAPAIRRAFRQTAAELASYDPGLAQRVRLVALNKTDLPGAGARATRLMRELTEEGGLVCHAVSALTGSGIDGLREALFNAAEGGGPSGRPLRVLRPRPLARQSEIGVWRTGDGFEVKGKMVEAIVARTDMSNPAALLRLRRQLALVGVTEALLEAGARGGDTVFVSGVEFLFDPDL